MVNRLKCPHCGFEPEYGVYVCQGCHAQIIYGTTYAQESQGGLKGILLGIPVILVIVWLMSLIGLSVSIFYVPVFACGELILYAIGRYITRKMGKDRIVFRR